MAFNVLITTPVVIVTSEGREERLDELLGLGAKACIKKPFRPEEIRNTLMDVLGMDEEAMQDEEAPEWCDF